MPGTLVNAGPLLSFTVTLNDAPPGMPPVSTALQVTVVVPRANVAPEAGAQVGVIAPSWASLAVAAKRTFAPVGPIASTVMSAGTVTTGGVFGGFTVIVKLALATLFRVSVAEQPTVVVPTANELPDAGMQEGTRFPATRS